MKYLSRHSRNSLRLRKLFVLVCAVILSGQVLAQTATDEPLIEPSTLPVTDNTLININGTQIPESDLGATAATVPFRHVIIGLDGVPYSTFLKAQQMGLFKEFKSPSKMVSTFPSISEYAWSKLITLGKNNAYQTSYYDWELGKKVGNGIATIYSNLPQDQDWEDQHIWRHYKNYLSSSPKQMVASYDDFEKVLLSDAEPRVFFTVFVQTDAVAHTKGEQDLLRLLQVFSKKIEGLQWRHLQKFGIPLEITMMSDHGNTLVNSRQAPIRKIAKQMGFEFHSEIESENDIVDIGTGMLSIAAFWMKDDRKIELAHRLALDASVDMTVYYDASRKSYVARQGTNEIAFQVDIAKQMAFILPESQGDVFGLINQGIPVGEWVSLANIRAASYNTIYPDSIQRVYEGMNDPQSGASLIIAFKPGYEYAQMGLFRFAQKILTHRSGTHGTLSAQQSEGFLASTHKSYPAFVPAREVTARVDGLRERQVYSPYTIRIEKNGDLKIMFGGKTLKKLTDAVLKIQLRKHNIYEHSYSDEVSSTELELSPSIDVSRGYYLYELPKILKRGESYELCITDKNKKKALVKVKFASQDYSYNRHLYIN